MEEQRTVSKAELRDWYENSTLRETMDHFRLKHEKDLYRLLDRAEIPRKQPQGYIKLVD